MSDLKIYNDALRIVLKSMDEPLNEIELSELEWYENRLNKNVELFNHYNKLKSEVVKGVLLNG